ncbi:HEAT repeat domain-containing protein [candidate division KSB1 bacterium]
MKIKILTVCMLVILITNFSMGNTLQPDYTFNFARLFKDADLIAIGTVKKVDVGKEFHKAVFEIETCIKGNIKKEIEIKTSLYNGVFKEHEIYLSEDTEVLLFLKKNNEASFSISSCSGFFSPRCKDDIELLLEQYNSNNNIFSNNHKGELKNIFTYLKNSRIKWMLLNDMQYLLDSDDLEFVSSLLYSSNVAIKIEGIMAAGRLKEESLYQILIDLLQTSNNSRIKYHYIAAISDYGKDDCVDLLIPFLDDQNQNIRRAVIEAAGKIKSEKMIKHLKRIYSGEEDFLDRIAVITSISFMKDKEKVKKTLDELLTFESDNLVKSFIEKTKKKIK